MVRAKSPKKHKLNIFEVLGNINSKNTNYYYQLSEDDRKHVIHYTNMIWMTGTDSALQIYLINEFVNPYVFHFVTRSYYNEHQFPDLLFYLMCTCSPGKFKKYNWPRRKQPSESHVIKVIKEYFGYSTMEAKEVRSILSKEDILSYAEELGWQKTEIATLKRELK